MNRLEEIKKHLDELVEEYENLKQEELLKSNAKTTFDEIEENSYIFYKDYEEPLYSYCEVFMHVTNKNITRDDYTFLGEVIKIIYNPNKTIYSAEYLPKWNFRLKDYFGLKTLNAEKVIISDRETFKSSKEKLKQLLNEEDSNYSL